jgi:hypothetical protein
MFTKAQKLQQELFGQLLKEVNLIDVFRYFYPNEDSPLKMATQRYQIIGAGKNMKKKHPTRFAGHLNDGLFEAVDDSGKEITHMRTSYVLISKRAITWISQLKQDLKRISDDRKGHCPILFSVDAETSK